MRYERVKEVRVLCVHVDLDAEGMKGVSVSVGPSGRSVVLEHVPNWFYKSVSRSPFHAP